MLLNFTESVGFLGQDACMALAQQSNEIIAQGNSLGILMFVNYVVLVITVLVMVVVVLRHRKIDEIEREVEEWKDIREIEDKKR